MGQEKIDVLSTQLQTLGQELALRILVLLDAKNDTQASCRSDRFDRLDRNTQDIVEVVSINQSILKSALAHHATEARCQGDQSDFVAKHRHEEVIAAILTLRDGNAGEGEIHLAAVANPTNSFVALTTLYGSVLYAAERAYKDTFLGMREQTR